MQQFLQKKYKKENKKKNSVTRVQHIKWHFSHRAIKASNQLDIIIISQKLKNATVFAKKSKIRRNYHEKQEKTNQKHKNN